MPNTLRSAKKETTALVTSLGRLIARMALDEALHRDYLDDPDSVIGKAGLSEEESKALKSNDWNEIVKLLGPKDRGIDEAEKDPGGG